MEGVGAVSELAQVGRKFPGSGLHTLFRKSQGDLEVTVGPPLSNLQMLPAVVPGGEAGLCISPPFLHLCKCRNSFSDKMHLGGPHTHQLQLINFFQNMMLFLNGKKKHY